MVEQKKFKSVRDWDQMDIMDAAEALTEYELHTNDTNRLVHLVAIGVSELKGHVCPIHELDTMGGDRIVLSSNARNNSEHTIDRIVTINYYKIMAEVLEHLNEKE